MENAKTKSGGAPDAASETKDAGKTGAAGAAAKPKDAPKAGENVAETGGPKGPEPTRYGDWERGGICVDF